MKTLLTAFFAVVLGLGMIAPDAEAKRFGGGSSFGKSYSTPKKTTSPTSTTQQKATTDTTKNATTATKPRSGFGGMMAGLLGAGLLGALFFGGAFEGIQFMDILLLGVGLFIVFKIISAMRKGQAQPQARNPYEYAGAGQQTVHAPRDWQHTDAAHTPAEMRTAPFSNASADLQPEAEPELPSWFNKDAFLAGATQHFENLQKAWDAQNWSEIATYTTPELLAELKAERAKHPAQQTTVVESVMVELANFQQIGDEAVVSLNFYGWLKENSDQTTEFNEIWHLSRNLASDSQDWFIVGIEQPQ